MNIGIPLLIDIYILIKLVEALDKRLNFWSILYFPFVIFGYGFLAITILYMFNM